MSGCVLIHGEKNVGKKIEVKFEQGHLVVLNGTTRKVAYGENVSLGCGKIIFKTPEKGVVSATRKTGSGNTIPFPSTFEVGKSYIIRSEGPPVRC